jgi:DNA (cytosine-5)-methyltransferase 1
MKYGSVCSGVEAATVAWHPLGWEPQWFSEIDKFPSAVLAHHYPNVPNLGDMSKFKEWNDDPIDLLVGGTPCQSFSVAGLRKGLNDPRGNLMLTYLGIADRYKPKWIVWENVPGVLSSNGGRDFGTFLGALGKLGYGFAYRVLDAQYFGVAQRRRRVFVVGHLGDWRRAAAVLFERESLSGHPAPSRETKQETAGYTAGSFGGYREGVGTIRAAGGDLGGGSETIVASTLTSRVGHANDPSEQFITEQTRVNAITASYGTGGPDYETKPLVYGHAPETAGALDTQCGGGKLTHQSANNGHLIIERDVIGTLTARCLNAIGPRDVEEGVLQPVAFPAEMSGTQAASTPEVSPTLSVGHTTAVANALKVRRLTPIECERLQGFPDDYTQIPWRNKTPDNCPDGPRYKAMGNSMAVPVMRWIGERIQMVDDL